MSRPRRSRGGLVVATGEIHHGGGHGHEPYAVAFGGSQQFTVRRVGTTAAKRHQYAVGHIELAPSLKRSDDMTGGPLFHHFWSTS